MNWREVTAIFGGTFDPPHLGHREAVAGLFRNPGVREVWVMPAASPPHKPAIATAEQRLELARLAFGPHPGFPFP
ncbi:MAG TPA: adenylyltransferase/cytidyltransferase family protein, partial [Bdellovibrionota bacterium]|nr:adenylyltransferase/cytidyltransferase family protein [Bdellovibrionota bacterium]